MLKMKKFMGAAMLAGATFAGAGVASADEASISGSVALVSDYVFRGVSYSENAPAIQGSFDYTNGNFYAGVWGSSVDFGSFYGYSVDVPMELDVYAGITPTIGPVSADFGIIGYLYPGANDDFFTTIGGSGEWNYWEVKAAGSISPSEALTLGAALYWSPELQGDGGEGLYYEINGALALSDHLSLSAAVGQQSADANEYFVTTDPVGVDSYTTWNIGGTMALHGFELDLRYSGTDEDIVNFFDTEVAGDKFTLAISRAL
jgi:uncharacterized protein (TIGR02001 family)